MRKTLSLLLVIAMLLSMCACGASGDSTELSAQEVSTVEVEETPEEIIETTPETEPEPTPESTWSIVHSTDEFGDVTEDSIPLIAGVFEGSFSNTATSDSDLTVVVNFMKKGDYNHYIALIDLKEYNDTNATYYSSDTITFKMKVGDEIIEDTMTGNPPNESVCLGVSEYSWGGDFLYNALYEGEDVRCIITIGSSEYNFTVTSDNFASVCEQNGYGLGAADLTVKEAVKIFLDDEGLYNSYAEEWLMNNLDKLKSMESDEIRELLEGYFVDLSVGYTYVPEEPEYLFPNWNVYEYSHSTNSRQNMLDYSYSTDTMRAFIEAHKNGESVAGYAGWRISYDPHGTPIEMSIENNMLVIYYNSSYLDKAEYRCYKITDDIFVLCNEARDGTLSISLYLRCNGYTREDVIAAVQYALEVSLPLIEN